MKLWFVHSLVCVVFAIAGCRVAAPHPIEIDPIHDACVQCRMIASDVRLAAQIVAPGAEPLIFDDIGCLRDYLAATILEEAAIVYVADHRTAQWVRAENALFTRTSAGSTPMGSGIVAHVDLASKEADSAASGGESLDVRSILVRTSAEKEGR